MMNKIINIYQYGCQKFCRDLSNPAPSFKVVKQVFFSTISPDLQNMGNFFLGATWEILTHPTVPYMSHSGGFL